MNYFCKNIFAPWLEDGGVSVLVEVVLETDGCNPASPANICNLQC